MQSILDPCCGSRMMWFDKQDQRCLFGDKRAETHLLPDGTIIENVEAVEVEDDEAFMPEIGFEKYPEATHFRKSK